MGIWVSWMEKSPGIVEFGVGFLGIKFNLCLNIQVRGQGNPGIKEDGFKEQGGVAKEGFPSRIFLGIFREYFLKDLSTA